MNDYEGTLRDGDAVMQVRWDARKYQWTVTADDDKLKPHAAMCQERVNGAVSEHGPAQGFLVPYCIGVLEACSGMKLSPAYVDDPPKGDPQDDY